MSYCDNDGDYWDEEMILVETKKCEHGKDIREYVIRYVHAIDPSQDYGEPEPVLEYDCEECGKNADR